MHVYLKTFKILQMSCLHFFVDKIKLGQQHGILQRCYNLKCNQCCIVEFKTKIHIEKGEINAMTLNQMNYVNNKYYIWNR